MRFLRTFAWLTVIAEETSDAAGVLSPIRAGMEMLTLVDTVDVLFTSNRTGLVISQLRKYYVFRNSNTTPV